MRQMTRPSTLATLIASAQAAYTPHDAGTLGLVGGGLAGMREPSA